ncbi:MAG: phosphate acyltransferase [Candidatus Omnitrophica bacterium]|nr:phosphate acyltransferase [Candidatus Omnitrophota bacterium]MDD5352114.1 phosphate acyltransferase [Candidatus Omnitrophota bacterium]MDD5549712.1 phosphate acyltransferase [Candidatus Omnitrophota bacterium]
MDIVKKIRDKARKQKKTIVLPEGDEPRTIEAIKIIKAENIANLTVLTKSNLDPQKVKEYSDAYFSIRQQKGITYEDAMATISNPLFYAAMMVKQGLADGFVAGAANTTADVARAAFYCLGLDKRFSVMSSSFIMCVPNCRYGEEGVFLFADCGIIPDPSPRQLANIAVCTSELARRLLDITPRVAMLSYSTKGSASGRFIDKIKEATALAKQIAPDLIIDGELQVDSAIVPEVARIKDQSGIIVGNANVLIFPNLEAGNISYKLVQRLANARAIGPILQGVNFPCSDLSRGCSVEDIVDCVAVTAIRSQK